MLIFVINSGSSSIKYQLIKMPQATLLCGGLVERIGLADASVTHKHYRNNHVNVVTEKYPLPTHAVGLLAVARLLTHPEYGVITNPDDITVIGHRVVHGGEHFAATTIITNEVKDQIKALFPLAPLHNPAHYVGIEVAESIFTKATQVAVFDTAFHQTMPPMAYRYAVPNSLYTENGVRVYGFHGTSHKYVSAQAAAYLHNPSAKIITVHLGNGCSMAAIDAGQCVDTSMGLGPLSGLIMGTRSGDIDPSVIFYLVNQLGYTSQQVSDLLNKQSGLLGLAGTSDMRDLKALIQKGNPDAKLAYDMYAYRIKKYIGAYAAVLNGLDAIVFTAGVGENDAAIRELSVSNLQFLGICMDTNKNRQAAIGIHEVNEDLSPVKILVVPTNEELEIAYQCFQLVVTY